MTTGRINQVAFVAVLQDDSEASSVTSLQRPATRAVHEAAAGSYCFLAFHNETPCLPTPSNLLECQSHKIDKDRALRPNLPLGRENILWCELTDSHSARYKRSDTRRARVLLSFSFWQSLFVQPILPYCTG